MDINNILLILDVECYCSSLVLCPSIYLFIAVIESSPQPFRKNVNVSVTVSPVSPWYKRYQWDASEASVLVSAQSDTDVCALLVLQNAKVRRHIVSYR